MSVMAPERVELAEFPLPTLSLPVVELEAAIVVIFSVDTIQDGGGCSCTALACQTSGAHSPGNCPNDKASGSMRCSSCQGK